ncbi:MAG: arginine deiminase family protein [bacterium]
MKKIFLVLIASLVVLSVIAFNLVKSNVSVPSPVSVTYEWGALQEVIVGSGKDLVIPYYREGMVVPEGPNANALVAAMKKYGGQRFDKIDPETAGKVIEQADNLAKTLESLGIVVHRVRSLKPAEGEYLGDDGAALFSRDPILVIGNNLIETSLRALFRRKEKYAIRPIVEKYITDPEVRYVSMPMASPQMDDRGPYLEGGDVLLNGYEIYVGNSDVATNRAGIVWLQNYLGSKYKVQEIKLTPSFLHLDCAMALLRPGLGIICREAIIGELPESLKDWKFIEVNAEEADNLATNVLVVDEKTVIADPQHQRVIEAIRANGIKVIEVPYDEVSKFGGAFRCSHHPLRRVN